MENKLNAANITLWGVFGVVFYMLFFGVSNILSSLINITAILLQVNKVTAAFLDLIPYALRLIFWIYLIYFFLLKRIPNGIIAEFPRKTAQQMTLYAIICIVLSRLLVVLQNYLSVQFVNLQFADGDYSAIEYNAIMVQTAYLIQSLMFIAEEVIIAVGFLLVIRNIRHQE